MMIIVPGFVEMIEIPPLIEEISRYAEYVLTDEQRT